MEIYSFYQIGCLIFSFFSKEYAFILTWAIVLGLVIWLAVFILQGIGLYAMAKRRSMKKKWLAFVPFANVYYMGKLAGDCGFFGHKMKNAGLYAMIAQIIAVLFTSLYIAAELYLYVNHGAPQPSADAMSNPYWTGLTGFSLTVSKFYDYGGLLYSIIGLVAELLLIVLAMGLYKKYAPRNYLLLTMLTLFVPIPVARFIIVFVLRNSEPIDYEAYMRARREAYIRRQQQQYGNPYNPNGTPYGNPYNTPYGQGGYAGQNGGQYQPPKPEDPFAEFSSDEEKTDAEKDNNSDGFFD